MRITKPYGRTETKKDNKRYVCVKEKNNPDIEKHIQQGKYIDAHDLVENKNELIIAQWISIIDKIAKKPKKGKATKSQFELRDNLGKACWERLIEQHPLISKFKAIWDEKIAPYPKETIDKRGDEKGKWYETFIGKTPYQNINAEDIAEKIYQHLYKNAYCLNSNKLKLKGLIEDRAESITSNFFSEGKEAKKEFLKTWNDETEKYYEKELGNIAKIIADRINDNSQKKRPNAIAGEELFNVYAKLFGKNVQRKNIPEKDKELLNLHDVIKDFYVRLLKKNKSKQVYQKLPKNMKALFELIEKKQKNLDVNSLIRLGKIIHYEALEKGNVVDNWCTKEEIEKSAYWQTNGQILIKQNEAFVRVWRHTLALSARTLKSWADPENEIKGDILLKDNRKSAIDKFNEDIFDKKFKLLFGKDLNATIDEEEGLLDKKKNLLKFALEGISNLRNNSFHFRNLNDFINALKVMQKNNFVNELWEEDLKNRHQQLLTILRSVEISHFFNKDDVKIIIDTIQSSETAIIPLPNFKRMIKRRNNVFKIDETLLDEENLCRYTILKLIYDKPFKSWLEKIDTKTINNFIDMAVEKSKNGIKNDKEKTIVAKATKIKKLENEETISDFFFRLTAETATEMRVQKFYESDSESAKEQAEYIEKLKLDVISLAFNDFLETNNLQYILKKGKAEEPLFDFKIDEFIKTKRQERNYCCWQKGLYFLVHLVPAGEINALLHQMQKWIVLNNKLEKSFDKKARNENAEKITQALELYLDMHDFNFSGNEEKEIDNKFQDLFEKDVFKKVFANDKDQKELDNLRRGLREIMRFGDEKALFPLFLQNKITGVQITEWLELKETIEEAQKTRKKLHKNYAKQRTLSIEDLKKYSKSLKTIVRYGHLNSHINLINHVRLHKLMMSVLGRLLDFSGLWERDLYFISLALMYKQHTCPKCVFDKSKQEYLKDGQIVIALKNIKIKDLNEYIKYYKDKNGNEKGIASGHRNNFAHFDMLQHNCPPNLTDEVNKARELMNYDRKLKNAVSKSIIDLIAREGLTLEWSMADTHNLEKPTIETKPILHLKNIKNLNDKIVKDNPILTENQHGYDFLKMVATLFGNGAKQTKDITDIDLEKINWQETFSAKK